MIVKPKIRGFICTTAHPKGCEQHVKEQIEYVRSHPKLSGFKNVLIIGSSMGYGLASRIVSAFGCGAATIGVFYERPAAGNRTASAGWYNSVAFDKFAKQEGIYSKSINGDAFSQDIKKQVVDTIKADLKKVDCVIYSLATPRRPDKEGKLVGSVLKTIGDKYKNKTVDPINEVITDTVIESATEKEIKDTEFVMGGGDWQDWLNFLLEQDVLSKDVVTVAYSYIGPELTYPMYRNGTIGRAKDHLEQTAKDLTENMQAINGKAYVSVNKAVVTQSSAAIPVVPLYIAILFKIMKEKGLHEGCIEQMYRLFTDRLLSKSVSTDDEGRIRIDDLEMRDDIQQEVISQWQAINSNNLNDISDLKGYQDEFYKLFGFNFDNVNYDEDVEVDINFT